MRYFVDLVYRVVPRGSAVLAATTFGSYALGLLRDRIFAHTFGASTSLDAYNAAFLVPDFAFNMLVASGIAAAAVPLFTELRKRDQRQAHAYMSSLVAMAIVTMFIVGVLLVVLAPLFSALVAPGIDEDGRALVVRLMRIVAFSPILFAASNALGAMLVAQKRFLFYGLSPICYNAGIIAGTLWLAPQFGIIGVAYGTLLGAAFHLGVRLIDALASGWGFKATWRMPAGLWRRTIRLMAPKMVGHPVELLTFWVFTSLASLLTPGSISILNFARNFQSVPVSLVGISIATAAFPALTEAALSSAAELGKLLRKTLLTILGVSTVAAIALFVVRYPVVSLLLGGGEFGPDAVARTALTLGVFCLAIPTESLTHVLARSFYATQNTTVPVMFSVISLFVAGTSAYLLLGPLDIVALPLGFFFGSLVKTIGLYALFLRRLDRYRAL